MSKKAVSRFLVILLIVGTVASVLGTAFALSPASSQQSNAQTSQAEQAGQLQGPIVSSPVEPADTRGLPLATTVNPLNEKALIHGTDISEQPLARPLPKSQTGAADIQGDPVAQTFPGILNMPATGVNFEGIGNVNGVLPPDTNGEVGRNHYVQMVNLSMAVYDKSGTLLYGPFTPNNLWPSGDVCNTRNDGDPIVLYDQLADRWLATQFALDFANNLYYQCIAVSKTGTPTNNPNDWYPYTFLVSTSKMNDYPKLGVWPDGYYMSANQFTGGASWGGAGVWAFDRANMLNGTPATFQYFDIGTIDLNYGGMLPSDLDGMVPPPAGTPNYFAEVDDSTWIGPNDAIRLWEFHVDWATPANTTFGLSGNPNAVLDTANFDLLPCVTSGVRTCIPQASDAQKLDAIGDRLMFRLAYRNFGDHESLVVNHSVWADGTDRAGVRWYEIRDPGGTPAIYQQGTYAPADGHYRWMGSIAMDHSGNMAMGYSVSSDTLDPSIRYAGRLADDPLGTMPQAEGTIIAGSGAQTHSAARWGDYSDITVDPVDDCTFWFTSEYIQTTGSAPWQTRIASFKFPGCTLGPTGQLNGIVDDGGNPIPNALVAAQGITVTTQTTTDATGLYTLTLPVDSYTVTASAYGYLPGIATGVTIISGTTIAQNFTLTPAAMYMVDGVVSDASTGWPLYASIDVSGSGYPGASIWTDPVTGYYSITLAAGITYTFSVNAWVPGYTPATVDVAPLTGNITQNFPLAVDTAVCAAPGYTLDTIFYDGFESGDLTAGGWTTATTNDGRVQVNTYDPYAGSYSALLDSAVDGSYSIASIVKAIDLSSEPQVYLSFWWHEYSDENDADDGVFLSDDSGATWCNIFSFNDGPGAYAYESIDLTAAAGTCGMTMGANTQIKFQFYDNFSIPTDGYTSDEVKLSGNCNPPADGGLLVGNVYDANTSGVLNGAQVDSDGGETAEAVATPQDANVDDAFYTIFSPSGSHTFTGTMSGGYGPDVKTPTIVNGDTVAQSFNLPAGQLSADPLNMSITLQMGMSGTLPLTLTNVGGLDAAYEMFEMDGGWAPLGPFETPEWVVKTFKSNDPDARRVNRPTLTAPPYAAGDVIQSWAVSQSSPWGVAYDAFNDTVWVGEGWGDNNIYEYATDGTATGRSYPFTWSPANGPADIAYNWNTGMLWSLDVGGDNCIHEIDPDSGVTGNTICPAFSISQRGVTYDPATDTYFAGSWNDASVHRFDHTGAILSSVDVGLDVAGLAYNPDTEHLFVMDNHSPNQVSVLDVANGYALIGQFSVTGFGDYAGAGLEFGSNGTLWAVNQAANEVVQFESGESSSLGAMDVPWLSEDPITGTVSAATNQVIDITFDAGAVSQPGDYMAQLKVNHDTPYALANAPVTMTVTSPATWGKLEGTINSLGYCDGNPAALEGADVLVEDSLGMTTTLTTNAAGYYSMWLDAGSSPVMVTASAAEHESGAVTNVGITAQMTTTENISLRWLRPCVSANPASFDVTVQLSHTLMTSLQIANAGAFSSTFALTEWDGGYAPPALPVPVYTPPTQSAAADGNLLQFGPANASGSAVVPLAPNAILNQPPNQVNGIFSDEGCDGCGSGVQVVAENFTVGASTSVGQIVIWTGYYPGNTPVPDNFTVIFHNDSSNMPGAAIYTEANVASSRVQTGVTLFGVDEWMHTLTLATPVSLPPGNYWVEIYNNTGTGTDDFFWETGDIDAVNGLTGSVWATTAPGSGWIYDSATEFAIQLLEAQIPIPWLSENPITGTVNADSNAPVELTFDATAVTQTGTYTGTLFLSSDDPMTSTVNVPVTMRVADAPICAFSNDGPTNLGSVTAFTNDTNENNAAATYSWDFGDGSPIDATTNPTHTYALPGNYTVTLTTVNAYGTDGCSASVSVEGVIAGFTSNSSVTLGDPVVFTDTTMANPALVNWFWTFGDGGTSSAQNPTHTYAAAGTYTVTLLAATASGAPGSYGINSPDNVYDVYVGTVTVLGYGVTMTPATAAMSGAPGDTVTYTLRITNTGNTTDTFTLSVSGNSWTTTPGSGNVTLAAGAGADVTVQVAIPASANGGDNDAATVTAVSQGDAGQSASSALTTTATYNYIYLPIIIKP